MLINATDLSLSSTHALEQSTTRQLDVVAQPRADASFAKLLESRIHAPPAQLLELESAPHAATGTQKTLFDALLELPVGLPDILAVATAFDSANPRGSQPRSFQFAELTRHRESERCSGVDPLSRTPNL